MTDARLQELYREALAARDASPGTSCPQPEALQALVNRDGTEQERLATLDHAFACASCSQELELLRALRAAAPTVRPSRLATPWVIAASAIIAVAAAAIALRSTSTGRTEMRGPAARGVVLAPTIAHASVLRWHAVPRAVSYLVEVMDGQGAVLAAGTTADTSFALPTRLRGSPVPNEQWWVRARLSDGSEVRSAIVPVGPR
ncbi:MAG TPA: hypothetical protein VFW04_08150 [Gemmatimonadaceae bacterium]|nr:hypothetical protein [Gemmatimonadaceae bacterium]